MNALSQHIPGSPEPTTRADTCSSDAAVLHASSASVLQPLLLTLWLGMAALCGAPLPAMAATAVAQTQPQDIEQLRQRQDLDVVQLRDLALREREAATGLRRAWATLAQAEFENDLEHADLALPLLDQAERIATEHQAKDLLFEVRMRRAVVLVNRGKTAETDAILSSLQTLVEEAGSPLLWRARLLHERGVLERKLGRFDRSLAFFEQALAMHKELNLPLEMARELNSIGMLHGRTGRFSDAVLAHNEALTLARKHGNHSETARSLRLLGILYRNLADEELGSRYLSEALQHVEERNRREAITLYGELGKSLALMDRFDEARRYAELAAELAERSGNPPHKVNAFTRMAELELETGQIALAEQWVDRAFDNFDSVAIRDQTLLRLTRVRVWAASGARAREGALLEAQRTLGEIRRFGDRILERAALDVLAELQLAAGDARAAFVTRKAHQQLDKELAMDVASRRIALLESSLERERSEAERALLERDNEIKSLTLTRQRLIGIALAVGIALLLLLAGLLLQRNRAVQRSNQLLIASRNELAQLHQALLRSAQELEHMAHTDALTELPNRHATANELQRVLVEDSQRCLPVSILLLDIDNFKQINDRHGHRAGDAVLKSVAVRLRDRLPTGATLGRWGGEEFLLILPECGLELALATAEQLRVALCSIPIEVASSSLTVSASIGVAQAIAPASAVDELVHAADQAMYAAKAAGRNRVQAALCAQQPI